MQARVGAFRGSIVEDRNTVSRADVPQSLSALKRRKRASGGAAS